jgi:FixJ family two-component response regulator
VSLTVIVVDDNVEFAGLVGTLIAEQGMRPVLAQTAGDGADMLEKYPDSVALVLDLLLPDLTGQKLLQRLVKKKAPLPPVFVMTGVFKGAAQQEKVRAICPLAGWFEKPFDTRLLVDPIAKLAGKEPIARKEHERVGQVTGSFDIKILEPQELDALVVKRPQSVAPTADLQRTPDLTAEDIDVDIDIEVAEEDEAPPAGPASEDGFVASENPTQVDVAPASSWGFDSTPTPQQIAEGLRTNLRAGDLASTTVPALLYAFYVAQETGEIAFERGDHRKIVYLVDGCPVYAISNQDADRFGALAKRLAGLPERDLARAIDDAKRSDRMLGDVLVSRGMIDRAKRDQLLEEQTRVIIRSLFAWTTGRYVVGFRPQTEFEMDAPPGEHPARLIINGVRDMFEIERLRALVPKDLRPMPSPSPAFELFELPLRDPEALILLRTTGARSISAIIADLRDQIGEREVLATMFSLFTLGVLVSQRASREVG